MPSTRTDLSGRTALITGGARGIGLAIARALTAAGSSIVVLDRIPQTAELMRAEFPDRDDVLSYVADVRSRADLERVCDSLVKQGVALDTLVVNAGTNVRLPALEIPDDGIRTVLDTNLYGGIVTLQVFAPLLLKQPGGRVIVTSSVIAIHGMDLRAVYAATKAGLSGLVRCLAIEWGRFGTTVNAVGPGIIRTPLIEGYLKEHPEREQAALKNTPLGRLGTPEDVADVVVFLASDSARFITGQTIFVDGGLSAGDWWW